MAARGRLGMLVETHSWRTYKERAASTYHTLQAVFEDAATECGGVAADRRRRVAHRCRARQHRAGR